MTSATSIAANTTWWPPWASSFYGNSTDSGTCGCTTVTHSSYEDFSNNYLWLAAYVSAAAYVGTGQNP